MAGDKIHLGPREFLPNIGGDEGRFETDADEYLPYYGHISDQVVALDDGTLLAMAVIQGLPYELEDHTVRNGRAARLNALAQLISDDSVTLHFNFVHGDALPDLSHDGRFQSRAARDIINAYQHTTFRTGVKANTWLLSVLVHPRILFESTVTRVRQTIWPNLTIDPEAEHQIEDVMQVIMVGLARYGVRRLGKRRNDDGWPCSEIGEALKLIMTTRFSEVPLSNGLLGGMVYTDPVVFGGWWGRHAFRVDMTERPMTGVIFGYKTYPNMTQVGMHNKILGVEYPTVLTHSFRFEAAAKLAVRTELRRIQMMNAGDHAITLLKGLIELQDKVASNIVVAGSHHFSLSVYGDDTRKAMRNAARAANLVSASGGATLVRETRGAVGAYFSQLPGCRAKYRCRPGGVSSHNLSHFVSLESFPRGQREGYWGDPVLRFKTNGATVYDWQPHVGEVGHTFVSGQTGSGKTLMLSMFVAAFERAGGDTGSIIIFDKDQGMEPFVRCKGGAYTHLRRGVASGCAPLVAYEGSPREIDHVAALFKRLILLDGHGPIPPRDETGMHRGVARQFKLPKHLRSMWGVHAFLGTEEGGTADRFSKWCRGRERGWLFDNERDEIDIDQGTAAFDFTELLPSEDRPDDGSAGAMAADIMFRLRGLMDGRRVGIFIDECRYYIDSIPGIIEDCALTGRKKELVLVLAAQRPSHLLNDKAGFGRGILAQCPTKFLFPDPDGTWDEYGPDGIGCTIAEYRYLKDELSQADADGHLKHASVQEGGIKRRLLIKRNGGSVVVEFDITGCDDEIAILSGRPDTANLAKRISEELGPDADPEQITEEFKRRWRSLPRIKKRTRRTREEEKVQ